MSNEALRSMPEDTKFFIYCDTPMAYSPGTGVCWKAQKSGYWKRIKPGCEQRVRKNYTSLGVGGKSFHLHRILAEIFLNGGRQLQEGQEVDHRESADGTHYQDRLGNLRLSTKSQNMHNKLSGRQALSGFRGVVRVNSNNWRAVIRRGGRNEYSEMFISPELAAAAYDEAAIAHFGEFALTNAKLGLLSHVNNATA